MLRIRIMRQLMVGTLCLLGFVSTVPGPTDTDNGSKRPFLFTDEANRQHSSDCGHSKAKWQWRIVL
jgi:hypothetical protein